MKLCLECRQEFAQNGWHCPNCNYQPELVDSVPLLAPELQSGFEARFFESLAANEAGHFWFEARNEVILWALKTHFPDCQTFLEVGGGTGFVSAGIQAYAPHVNITLSELFIEGLEIAKTRLKVANFVQMDAQNIPYRDHFDVIGSFDVLEHVPNDVLALNQMYKATRPGGGLILSVPQHPWLWSVVDDYGHHQRRYTRDNLEDKVNAAGFEIRHMTSFMSLTLPMFMFSRFLTRNQTIEDYDPRSEMQLPRPINASLRLLLRLEAAMLRYLSLPVGSSLLLVAQRPLKP